MDRINIDQLAVDVFKPEKLRHDAVVVMVHGAYGSSCHYEKYGQYFSEQGYLAYAVSLSGHKPSADHARLAVLPLSQYVQDVQIVITKLELTKVVLIGHSMGGSIVQKVAEGSNAVQAVVILAGGPPRGVAFAVRRYTRGFKLFVQMGKGFWGLVRNRPMQPEYAPARLAVLNNLSEEESHKVFSTFGPESWVATAQVSKGIPINIRQMQAPVLVVSFGKDAFILDSMQQAIAKFYQGDYVRLDNLAHMGILEAGWRQGCETIYKWLMSKGL